MRLVLTGGGTAGHIYPGLTLWQYIKQVEPDSSVLYIGSERGLERDLVTRANLPFSVIEAAALKRQLSLSAVRTAVVTYRGYQQSKRLLREFKPDVVVGTGGYVTLPVVYAASRLGIPSVIWEANARPGLTNQLCSRRAGAVAISFEGTERYFPRARRVVLTGNPRASEVQSITKAMTTEAQQRYRIDPTKKLILLFAGSRGAETVNDVMLSLIPRFASQPKWQLIHVTGEKHYETFVARVGNVPENVQILPFVYDMPALMPLADVVITRAGGATLAEICAFGIASILIPSPYVTANHQEENAKRLVEAGAARMLRESDLTADNLWRELSSVLESGKGATLRDKARAVAKPHSVETLYTLVKDVTADHGTDCSA